MLIDADEIRQYYPALLTLALRRHRIAGSPPGVDPADWVQRAIQKLIELDSIPCPTDVWLKKRIFQLSTNEARGLARKAAATQALSEEPRDDQRSLVAADLTRRALMMLNALAMEARSDDVVQLIEAYELGFFKRSEVAELLGVDVPEIDRRRAKLRRLIDRLPIGLTADVREFFEDVTA